MLSKSLSILNGSFEIRGLKNADANALHTMVINNSERMKEYFPITLAENSTQPKSENYISNCSEKAKAKKHLTSVIVDKSTNEFVGLLIMKNLVWNIPKGEIAYMVNKAYGGKGIMTEAVTAFCDYFFKEMNLLRIYACVSEENVPSIKLAKRCGFEVEGLLRKEYRSGLGELKNVFILAKIKD